MDKHSELEVKLDATSLTTIELSRFVQKVDAVADIGPLQVIGGKDTFYQKDEAVVRHRFGDDKLSVLTIKKRKNKKDIIDRHEVDLPVAHGVDPKTIQAFFKLSGFKSLFSLRKTSYIYHIAGNDYKACIAMYDAAKVGSKKKYRFLEIEIDKDSKCSDKEGRKHLDMWVELIKCNLLPESKPLNVSLFELFKGKKK